MIKKYCLDGFLRQTSLLSALELENEKNPIISLIGAGGKTTTMKRLVKEYNQKKIPVIVTTTTHLMKEDQPWFLLEPSEEKAMEILDKYGKVWIGQLSKEGKMQCPDEVFLEKMMKKGYPVLIEADGARRLPLKVPAMHEPVYHSKTTHVLNLYGMDCIGKTLEDTCFRVDLAVNLLKKSGKDMVCPEDLSKLMLHRESGRKDVPLHAKYYVVLNKTDTVELEKTALEICKISKKKGFDKIIITGNSLDEMKEN